MVNSVKNNNGSSSTSESSHYTVKSGDTLSEIAKNHGVSVNELVKANPQISNPNVIHAGQAVHIPGDASTAGTAKTGKTGSLSGLTVSHSATPPERPTGHIQPAFAGTPTQGAAPHAQASAVSTHIPKTGNSFIDSVSGAAIKSQRETGVPASVTIAQAILESGWGKSGLAQRGNNYFGIKGHGPAGSITLPTQEYENGHYVTINAPFRAYHNAAESFADHGRFFLDNSRYHTALQHTNDAHRFAQEIQRAGYATDPHYASSLNSLIDRYGLTRFDNIARGNAPIPSGGSGGNSSPSHTSPSNSSPSHTSPSHSSPSHSSPTSSGAGGHYTVKSGDTLSGIASRHGVSLSSLERSNPQIANPNMIMPGERINMPGSAGSGRASSSSRASSYTVRSGDSMSAIAARHGVSLSSLERSNPQIANPNMIFAGQHINIPGGSGGGSGSATHTGGSHSTSGGTHSSGGSHSTSHTGGAPAGGSKGGSSAAFNNARDVMGHNISQLKYSGPLAQYLDKWPGNNVCCANFVSACLQKAGQINHSEHNDSVRGLTANLANDSRWSRTSLANAKPGDVVAFNVPGEGPLSHVVMFAGWSGGRPEFIGSNNVNSDGSQRITEEHMSYPIAAIYHYHG